MPTQLEGKRRRQSAKTTFKLRRISKKVGQGMLFKTKTHQGLFVKRYKRFFADVVLNGETVVAHVANTGSLKSVIDAGEVSCVISESDNPERKLKFSLEMVQAVGGAWVGVNTSVPNQIVKETLFETIGKKDSPLGFSHWSHYTHIKAEFKISAETRLDFALSKEDTDKKHFIEVKNVTYRAQDGSAQFPDAETVRGQKHLTELMHLIDQGHTAEIVFTIQRTDCNSFSPADTIDPEYGRLLRLAYEKGVRISPFVVNVAKDGVTLTDQVLSLKL